MNKFGEPWTVGWMERARRFEDAMERYFPDGHSADVHIGFSIGYEEAMSRCKELVRNAGFDGFILDVEIEEMRIGGPESCYISNRIFPKCAI